LPEMKIKVEISGPRVHDVGYRALLLEAAEDQGLEGFTARNLKLEGVHMLQILVQGEDVEVKNFQEILERERPAKAEVYSIEFEDYDGPVEPIGRYSQRFTGAQLRKGIASLTSIDEKQDRMLEKQDETIEVLKGVKEDTSAIRVIQDRMLEKQDRMLEKQDRMLEKQDESVELLKGVKDDTSAIRDGLCRSVSRVPASERERT